MRRILYALICLVAVSQSWGADVKSFGYTFATDPDPRVMRNLVCTSTTVCYSFGISNEDSVNGWAYTKTTDGGATWGTKTSINSTSTTVAGDVWYDQWTPGDTGTLIHTWYFDTTNDDVFYRTLDTASDTLGTERTVFNGATSVAGRGTFCSGTKTRSGYLYVAYDIDAGAEKGLQRSTDSGATWSANLATTFVEATADECMLFPATGTLDNNDMWAIYQDASANELTMKMWDSSAIAEVESSSMQACIENTTDEIQRPFAGAVRLSDGHLIVVSNSDGVTGSNNDAQAWDVSAVNAGSQTGILAKTNLTTNTANNYYYSVYVDSVDKIYVSYNGKRDGSETLGSATKVYYTSSTDGGTTWATGDTAYMQGTAGVVNQTWSSVSGPLFLVQWRQDRASPNSGNWTNAVSSVIGPTPTPTPTPTPSNQGNFFPFFQP